jgi:hypothetical protein
MPRPKLIVTDLDFLADMLDESDAQDFGHDLVNAANIADPAKRAKAFEKITHRAEQLLATIARMYDDLEEEQG